MRLGGFMALTHIKLYYDVLSPYSWIGFELLHRYAQKWMVQLERCPVYLSGIMSVSGNRPPGVVPAKSRYMSRDLLQLGAFYQIPLHMPSDVGDVMFVKGSLSAQRFLTATKLTCPEYLESLSRQLWLRIWSRDEDIASDDSLIAAAEKTNMPREMIDKLIAQIHLDQIKEELKKATQEALDSGAFGVPWIVAQVGDKKNVFFGSDRIELLANMIGEKYEGPLVELKSSL